MLVKWDESALRALLCHRLERAGLVPLEGKPALDGLVEGMEDPDTVLIQAAEGSPARLIALGNRLIRQIGQTDTLPLTLEEFQDILAEEGRR